MAERSQPAIAQPDPETGFGRVKRRGLRTGYTTGACATAAAKAATTQLLTQAPQTEVTIDLPIGRAVTFALHRSEWRVGAAGAPAAFASVIKDAGDDPDVTHGAEIQAQVEWVAEPGIELRGGGGVGVVTRPGLGLAIGGPAINPVPRRMILEAVGAVLGEQNPPRGVRVTISVPNGEELAKKTLNGRLGILGGISILGTSGIVYPYSTASWRASVEQAIDIAAANGLRHVVLATGGRSEKFAQARYPAFDPLAFVEMAEFTGHALKRCIANRIPRATLVGMVGKFAKLAQGHMMTHVAGNQVDPNFLAGIAANCGADPDLVAAMRNANTARHFQELAQTAGLNAVFNRLCELVGEQCYAYAKAKVDIEALMFDFDGALLGQARHGAWSTPPSPTSAETRDVR